jgi:hypothetical protein
MSGTITRGSIPRLLLEGVDDIYGTEITEYKPIWSQIYKKKPSKKGYEVSVMMEGLSPATVKGETEDITYDSRKQGFAPKYVHSLWAKGVVISYETMRDEQYGVFTEGARMLFRSMKLAKEIDAARIFNTAFSTSSAMLGGDGVALCSTAHITGPSGGTYSNRLAVDADFSEATLEDALLIVSSMTDSRGYPQMVKAESVLGHTDLQFDFERVLKSSSRTETANNDISATYSMKSVPKGAILNPYLTADRDAWFLLTDVAYGAKMYQREEVKYGQDEAFSSLNMRFRAIESYVFGYDDPRFVVGSSGM